MSAHFKVNVFHVRVNDKYFMWDDAGYSCFTKNDKYDICNKPIWIGVF